MAPLDALVDYARHRHLILLIDNCEHLIDDAAKVVERLLTSTEHVTIIAGGVTQATGTVAELRGRSTHRHFEVRWAGDRPDWAPAGAEVTESEEGVSRFVVDAATDAATLVAEAATHGEVAAVSYTPPGLEEIFLELVG